MDKPAARRSTRSRQTHLDVMRVLRRGIVSGKYAPGGRMPTRIELSEKTGASSATIQKAVDTLIEQGFLETRDREGTFVRVRLPYLRRVGLVFPPLPAASRPASRFWTLIREAAERLGDLERIEVRTYAEVEPSESCAAYRELVDDLQGDRLAAVVGVSLGWKAFAASPLLAHPRLARLALMGYDTGAVPKIQLGSYAASVVEKLASRGRKRLAVIYGTTGKQDPCNNPQANLWKAAAARKGLEILPHWLVPVHAHLPQAAWVGAQLLFQQKGPLPDALMVDADFAVEPATEAIAALGLRVPNKLDVAVHTNFPDRPLNRVPAWHVGYDIAGLLEQALSMVERQLAGEVLPPSTTFEAAIRTPYAAPEPALPALA